MDCFARGGLMANATSSLFEKTVSSDPFLSSEWGTGLR